MPEIVVHFLLSVLWWILTCDMRIARDELVELFDLETNMKSPETVHCTIVQTFGNYSPVCRNRLRMTLSADGFVVWLEGGINIVCVHILLCGVLNIITILLRISIYIYMCVCALCTHVEVSALA